MPRNVNSKSVQANGHLDDFRLNTNFIGSNYYNDSEIKHKRKIKLFCTIDDLILFSQKVDSIAKKNKIKKIFKKQNYYKCYENLDTVIYIDTSDKNLSLKKKNEICKFYLCHLNDFNKDFFINITNSQSINENQLAQKKKCISFMFTKYFIFQFENKSIKIGQQQNKQKNDFFIEFEQTYIVDNQNIFEFATELLKDLFNSKNIILKQID